MDKLSYALGMSIGQSLVGTGVKELTFDDFLSGVKVCFTGEDPEISPEFCNQILKVYFDKIKKEQEEKVRKESKENLKKADEYLNENTKKLDVMTTDSGLQYKVITEAYGKQPGPHSRVRVHYEGRLTDGTVFDSSYKRGTPTEFGLGQVIPGWTEGLQLMKEGSIYEFTIPPALGYGEVGVPGHIPGNSVLIFKVELIKVM